jgi:hypothetical protein
VFVIVEQVLVRPLAGPLCPSRHGRPSGTGKGIFRQAKSQANSRLLSFIGNPALSYPAPVLARRDLRSHDFRRAAFTRAAFDVTLETMLRYSTATEKKKTSDDVLTEQADKLLPRPSPKSEPELKRDEED